MEYNDLGGGRIASQATPNPVARIPNHGVQIRHLAIEVVDFIKLRAVEVSDAIYQASVFESLYVDTTGSPITVRTPVGASLGDSLEIIDAVGNFAVNNVLIQANGSDTVMGGASYLLSTSNRSVTLKYRLSTRDWRVVG